MLTGFDTTSDVTGHLPEILNTLINGNPVDFIGRYLNPSWKGITLPEVHAIHAAGLSIVSIYERNPVSVEYFSASVGHADAVDAFNLARALGQPTNRAIYAAVDFDATADDYQSAIKPYFTAFRSVLMSQAALTGYNYARGVYGSGLICRLLMADGLVSKTWLAQSKGFQGYQEWLPNADIVQGDEITDWIGLDIDTDTSAGSPGAW